MSGGGGGGGPPGGPPGLSLPISMAAAQQHRITIVGHHRTTTADQHQQQHGQQGQPATATQQAAAQLRSVSVLPSTTVRLAGYHVPRGPAAVASLSAAPRSGQPVATPLQQQQQQQQQQQHTATVAKPIKCWSTTTTTAAQQAAAHLRPATATAVVYAAPPRAAAAQTLQRPQTLQVTAGPRPTTIRPMVTQPTAVTRAIRPSNVPSPQRTPPPQILQAVTTVRANAPKVVPILQRNYSTAKVVGVTVGVRPPTQPRNVGGTYYYEVSSGVAGGGQQSQSSGTPTIVSSVALSTSVPVHSLPENAFPLHSAVASFVTASSANSSQISEASHRSTSPVNTQRPSILRKSQNDVSPVKSQWPPSSPPPPSPGGSTTVSAASSPELDDDEPPIPPPPLPQPPPMTVPSYNNNCSPRKKPRKQLLNNENRMSRGDERNYQSDNLRVPSVLSSPPPATAPPPPPPEPEKPPRRAMLSAAWTCGWRANALHFMRPSDVKKREEKRPTVVELASQKHVLQKANGWKIHHLTAQMEDLIELETSVLQEATESLRVLESYNQPDLDRVCELLKGNIQRSKIVCEGVTEAKTNVLRIFQHKTRVSDILARQADKRCFKKQRNQY